MGELTGTVTEAMAKRAGRDPGDLAVRVSMGALIGGNMAAAFAALEEGGDVLEYVVERRIAAGDWPRPITREGSDCLHRPLPMGYE